MLKEALLGPIVARAGQAGEVEQDGDLVFFRSARECLRWEVQVENHFAAGGRGIVG